MALDALAGAPWPFILAFSSLGLLWLAFKGRESLLAEAGFGRWEVALLCLGSIAGWVVNVPVLPLGDAYLAVNLGGALVPVILVLGWLRTGRLGALSALLGIAIVSFVAHAIARFDPQVGIVASFPSFFLPSIAALLFAVAMSPARLVRSVPLAYASGSIGALVGADLLNLPRLLEAYGGAGDGARESVLVSLGGAGVFDMVSIAGTLAMAAALVIVIPIERRAVPVQYPGARPARVWNARRLLAAFGQLRDATPGEHALAGLARSNEALASGDDVGAVRWAHASVAGLLHAGDPPIGRLLEEVTPDDFKDDVATLDALSSRADLGRREALAANEAAKFLVAALARAANEKTERLPGGSL
ncbi:MAG TPA: DUF1614 domain-containing protein [Candidatus Thermoplasmatota archaeon]|nr:DUF1614 domain-containing protein [Candidatus Thermoplasmatota archaeon]